MKQQILIPAYYKEFSCIGAACEDTCCAGWRVSVDKDSFKKYRSITKGPLAQELKQNVSRNRSNSSNENYAKLKMDEQGRCTLLADDGLCKIQRDLGEEFLCHTCSVYPRNVSGVDQRFEKSLTPSCPEAARLILLNEQGIDFLVEEEESDMVVTHVAEAYFWDIRMFAIELLQNRRATIEERLIVLGLFIEGVQKLLPQERAVKIPQLKEKYATLIEKKEQLDVIQQLPSNISFQLSLVHKLIEGRLKGSISNGRYQECIEDVISGLKMNDDGSLNESVTLYEQAYENYYKPFNKQHGYMLENYLVNLVFKHVFPKKMSTIFQEYINFVIHFTLIKTHLIGMGNEHKGLTKEILMKCIQSFSKTYEHNASFFTEVLKELKVQKYHSMAHMIVLIKS